MMDVYQIAVEINELIDNLVENGWEGGCDVINILAVKLDNMFQQAELKYKNVDITTPAGSLNFDCRKSGHELIYEIAYKICKYWSKTVELTGEPVKCDKIIRVEVDSMKHVDSLYNRLLGGVTNKEGTYPYYDKWLSLIVDEVKTFKWIVEEKHEEGSEDDCNVIFENYIVK